MSDIALADAAAQAARAVPGVTDLSPGLSAPAATYGPGRTVAGIVVHHPTPDTLALEVHVILSEAHCTQAFDAAADMGEHHSEPCDPITEIAHRVRGVVRGTTQDKTSLALRQVDVFVDDLR